MVSKDFVGTQHRLTCRVGSCRVRALSVHRCDLGSTQAWKLCRLRLVVGTLLWVPFLESPENFSGPKSHSQNSAPLIQKSWSFHVVKGTKTKITATFRASRRLRFEYTQRIISPEILPKGFGASEKRAPAQTYFGVLRFSLLLNLIWFGLLWFSLIWGLAN